MVLENYCKRCGHRILPTDPYCTGCGCKTGYDATDDVGVFTLPIYNIGFFNFDIDFSQFSFALTFSFAVRESRSSVP